MATLCNSQLPVILSANRFAMRRIYTLLPVLLLCTSSFAQSILIKGSVKSGDGAVISLATIAVKGGSGGTTIDTKGTFTIRLAALPATLVCSAVGFEKKEVRLTSKDTAKPLQIILKPSTAALEEVVVTAYGMEGRRDMAYSVAPTRVTRSLEGKVSGLYVEGASRSKKVTIRGATSASSGAPRGKAGLLTAGELSDFKKWKLWGDYSDADFKTYSEHWGIAPRHRYCVQVQNGSHRAIIGEKVFLIDSDTRDTVWSAVTDNTGKAELWAGIGGGDAEQNRYTLRCGGEVVKAPLHFEQGINRITLSRDCATSRSVDIAFVVDATGSMGDEIAYLQTELQDIISRTAAGQKDVNLRLGSVFYRDHGDEYLTRHLPFTVIDSELQTFISKQTAGGGGDGPEAVEAALSTALDSLQWSAEARARILFLVLDAPPHDDAATAIQKLVKRAAAKGIRMVPVVCSGIDKSTEYLMRAVALATNGSYVFLTDDSGIGGKHIKPTTDEFKVELLNDLLVRIIGEMLYVVPCDGNEALIAPPSSTTDSSLSKITVYPNPTSGKITIEAAGSIKEWWVTDFAGKVLLRGSNGLRKHRWAIDLSAYPAGTYLVKYLIDGVGWRTEKVVVAH